MLFKGKPFLEGQKTALPASNLCRCSLQSELPKRQTLLSKRTSIKLMVELNTTPYTTAHQNKQRCCIKLTSKQHNIKGLRFDRLIKNNPTQFLYTGHARRVKILVKIKSERKN